jgi:HD superfamily phosphohydrolase
MGTLYDILYNDVAISTHAKWVMANPFFERLAFIRQTSMAYRVFPSATHSRLSHSVGTYALTKHVVNTMCISGHIKIDRERKISKEVVPLTPTAMTALVHSGVKPKITEFEIELMALGGLLHDIGHGPSSHTFDDFVAEMDDRGELSDCSDPNPWRTHEVRSQYISRHILAGLGFDAIHVNYVLQMINPSPEFAHDWRFQLVNNKVCGIDVDKLDYLVRDAQFFGLCPTVNVQRICFNSRIGKTPNGTVWGFSPRVHDEINNVFESRFNLYRNIYHHPKVVKFELAFRDLLRDSKPLITAVFKSRDIVGFCTLLDDFMVSRGSQATQAAFFGRRAYALVAGDKIHETATICIEKIAKYGHPSTVPYVTSQTENPQFFIDNVHGDEKQTFFFLPLRKNVVV